MVNQNMKKNKNNRLIVSIIISYFILALLGLILIFPAAQESLIRYFAYNSELALLLLGFFIIIIISSVPILLVTFFVRSSKNEYEIPYNGRINEERDNLERQLYELNERLSATESKWRESYNLILESQDILRNTANGMISPDKFLQSFGISLSHLTINPKEVFVITPFNNKYAETYAVIKKACSNVKLNAVRSDEDYIQRSIMKYIIEKIVTSRIIIANVDGRNANVMYELGIAHALNKPTIIIDKGNQLVPFDINGNHVVIYTSLSELEGKLVDQLKNILVND